MRKFMVPILTVLLLVSILGAAGVGSAESDAVGHVDQQEVELTEKQQKKLAKLHQRIFKQKKKLISKYVEFDVITEEKGEKIIAHMQAHLEELEKNGYMPDCQHHKHDDMDRDDHDDTHNG